MSQRSETIALVWMTEIAVSVAALLGTGARPSEYLIDDRQGLKNVGKAFDVCHP
jgi:hypothetical protein